MKVLAGWIMAAVFAFLLLWQLGWLPEMTVLGWIGWAFAVPGWGFTIWFLYDLSQTRFMP